METNQVVFFVPFNLRELRALRVLRANAVGACVVRAVVTPEYALSSPLKGGAPHS